MQRVSKRSYIEGTDIQQGRSRSTSPDNKIRHKKKKSEFELRQGESEKRYGNGRVFTEAN